MARPIQNTPILKGKDARDFKRNLLDSITRKLSPEEKKAKEREIQEMENSYNKLVSISNGAFY